MKLTQSEQATLNFYEFDYKGRGYYHFPFSVEIEPPFRSFSHSHYLKEYPEDYDDGVALSYFKQIKNYLLPPQVVKEEEVKLQPKRIHTRPSLVALQLNFPKRPFVDKKLWSELLDMLAFSEHPLSFEIIGTYESINIQIVCSDTDERRVMSHCRAYFPTIQFTELNALELPFQGYENIAICDFGLEEEFMRPLKSPQTFALDNLTSIFATLEHLKPGDLVVYQIIFKGVRNSWSQSILNAVTDSQGGSFFADAPEMLQGAKSKIAKPLFAVVIRLATQAQNTERAEYIASEIIKTVSTFSKSEYNRLIPLSNEGYQYQHHIENLFYRQTNRLGMILNTDELVSFVHYPHESIISSKLGFSDTKTKKAPSSVLGNGCLIGINVHQHEQRKVYLSPEQRLKHTHVIGVTGTGKSTLLANMILDDISRGDGLVLFDPHGDIVDDILVRIPEYRKNDVIIIDPSDTEFPIGFNLLQAQSDAEKIVLSSDLVVAFKRHASAWGDNMTAVLSNAINTFLESDTGGTLIELKRFLIEESFRASFLETVDDNGIHYYWKYEYPMVKKGIAPLLTRIDTFLRPKIIRYMLAQKSGIDIKDCIESKKIVLLKLAQGLIGEENSYLLGSLFISKFNQVALARQHIAKEKRHPYYIYLDEFHNFITPSITSMLSGVRKYGIGLILAHQELTQIEETKIQNAVISNPYTRICFRLGDNDAKKLENGFSFFEQSDLQSLDTGEAIMRVGSSAHDFSLHTPQLSEEKNFEVQEFIIQTTRKRYTKTKREVDIILNSQLPQPRKTKQEVKETKPIKVKQIIEKNITALENVTKEESKTHENFDLEKQKLIEREEKSKQNREHNYIQTTLKKLGQQHGFLSIIEKQTNLGGRIDLSLEKNGVKIACEISVTNKAEYEIENIKKCLLEEYNLVLMISKNEKHLNKIKKLAETLLSKNELKIVFFITPKKVSEYLNCLASSSPKDEVVRGFRVTTEYEQGSYNSYTSIRKSIVDLLLKKRNI